MTIEILLGIIAVSEVLRLVLTHKRVSKKGYFKQKRTQVRGLIFDLEFKKFKTREIREDIRVEYDSSRSRLLVLEEKIKQGPGKEGIDEFKRLDDQKVLLERDIKRFEEQMVQLDLEIKGTRPTADYPNGVQGIDQQIDSLVELKKMIEDWIKSF